MSTCHAKPVCEHELRELAEIEILLGRAEAEARVICERERARLRAQVEEKKAVAPRFSCDECGHVCTRDGMDSDSIFDPGSDEAWSNWICPECKTWHEGLRPGEGWARV